MSGFRDKSFGERLSTASAAKQGMVTKFLKRPGLDDPAVIERNAARVAASLARDTRRVEREAARTAENARLAAERQTLADAAAQEEARLDAEKAAQDANLEIQRKAARDARYAARKARK